MGGRSEQVIVSFVKILHLLFSSKGAGSLCATRHVKYLVLTLVSRDMHLKYMASWNFEKLLDD